MLTPRGTGTVNDPRKGLRQPIKEFPCWKYLCGRNFNKTDMYKGFKISPIFLKKLPNKIDIDDYYNASSISAIVRKEGCINSSAVLMEGFLSKKETAAKADNRLMMKFGKHRWRVKLYLANVLQLIINDKGELLDFLLTPGNVDDRAPLKHMDFHKRISESSSETAAISRKTSSNSSSLTESTLLHV